MSECKYKAALRELVKLTLDASPCYQAKVDREEVEQLFLRHKIEWAENTTRELEPVAN